jgi:hypothetical protein
MVFPTHLQGLEPLEFFDGQLLLLFWLALISLELQGWVEQTSIATHCSQHPVSEALAPEWRLEFQFSLDAERPVEYLRMQAWTTRRALSILQHWN